MPAIPNSLNGSTKTLRQFHEENKRLIEARNSPRFDSRGNPLFGDASKIVSGWQPSSMVTPGRGGFPMPRQRIGSAGGAFGSRGMPTSQRGRFEKFGSEAAANMTTSEAMDVAQNSDALGGIGFGGLREIFNQINPTPGMPAAPTPVAATQALPEIPKSLTITQPQLTTALPGALPLLPTSPVSGSVNSTTNPLTVDESIDPNDPRKLKKKSSLFGSAPGMVAQPILSSIFAGLTR